MSRSLYRLARHAHANYGLFGILREGTTLLGRLIRHRAGKDAVSDSSDQAKTTHPFDLAHGVDTGGVIWGENLPTPHANALWATAYYGIAPSVFDSLIVELETRFSPDWTNFTFIDLGCGKGRALMLASRLPFRSVLGIEISPELTSIARQNLAVFSAEWQQCRTLEVREGDAAAIELPLTPLVLYLYHPFATPVLEAFLRNVDRSLANQPRETWLLYFNPALEKTFSRHPRLERQFFTTLALEPKDALADRFYNKEEKVVVYRYLPAADRSKSSTSS